MRKAVFLLAGLAAGSAWGGDFSRSEMGTASGQFLKLGAGARAVAMGEAVVAVADDATALYWNPAGLTRIEKRSVTLMHSAYAGSTSFDYIAFGARLSSSTALGISLQYLNAGRIPMTDASGADIGGFSPNDLALTAGLAYKFPAGILPRPLEGLSVGAGVKFIQSQSVDTARTWALDFGLLSRPYLGDRLRLAFSAANMGGRLRYDQQNEPLPAALRAGASYQITRRWLASLDGAFPRDEAAYGAMGTEYLLAATNDLTLAARLGLNSRNLNDVSGIANIATGLGFAYKSASLDYAIVPYGGIAVTHRVSISCNF